MPIYTFSYSTFDYEKNYLDKSFLLINCFIQSSVWKQCSFSLNVAIFKFNFYFQACEYLLCNVVAVFINRESKLRRILTTALCALLQYLYTRFYFVMFYRQSVLCDCSCHGAQARKFMFEQIPPRRVLEMHRGPGLPLGLPGCIWWGLSPPLGTASSTAAATAAATTGFTPGSGPGPSHGFTMARPAR